ncbi:HAMP domain-containing histidine kinase [Lactobacillus sp.]|uniref:HAMP domain-containing sensor histidine kinase n=1 Tax=Lactobacillus sp. TaxID=1591 RepID=UPI0025B7F2D5|nr:HAMP domain-containing histidine kinase [Lactobacillus sp.]
MSIVKKSNKKEKKETKKSSLTFKWVSIVAATITVSFVIFSIAIYSLIRQQLIQNDQSNTQEIVSTFQKRLVGIPEKLQISNVVPQLSPNTSRILENSPVTSSSETSVFNDEVLATLANRDTSITIYDTSGDIVFSNGNNISERMPKITANNVHKLVYTSSGLHLDIYQKIYSDRTHKLTGYLVVDNSMTQTNKVLHTIRWWMVILSFLAIVIFIILSYLVVNSVVKPIKKMSKISHKINADPNSQERIPDLNRTDELGELANSFNQMLDRMQAYIQQQKQFVGDVSHELRTPVAVIQGHMSLLQRWGKDDPKVLDESIESSLQEANRMKHLIQEMLDLTRAEQIDIQFPNEVTEVNGVLKRTVDNMQMIHPDFRISYDDADLKPHCFIKMYSNHLEQVLIILMDNAIKYSKDRKEILVDAANDQDSVIITVQDFGEGIAAEEQKKIFNRFYRVDKARTREKGGNGLGLSIAQKLVESYHGKIGVTSQLGSGSKFKIEFPLLKEDNKKSKNDK